MAACIHDLYFLRSLFKSMSHWTMLIHLAWPSLEGKSKINRTAMFFQFCYIVLGILLWTDVEARVLGILVVDWIVQYNPLSNSGWTGQRPGRTRALSYASFNLKSWVLLLFKAIQGSVESAWIFLVKGFWYSASAWKADWKNPFFSLS